MKEDRALHGPARPMEEFEAERENNLSYMSFMVHSLYKLLALVSILFLLAGGTSIYLFVSKKDVHIIALTPDMRVVPLRTLDDPMVSDSGLLSWYMQTISDTFSFNYNDWQDSFAAMQNRYTSTAFAEILNGFQPYIEEISSKRTMVNAYFTKLPRIMKKYLDNGVYTWWVEGLVTFSIEGGTSRAQQNVLVKSVIQRANPAVVPTGVVIKSVILVNE